MTAGNPVDAGAKMSPGVIGVNLWKTVEVSYGPTLGYSTRLPATPCYFPGLRRRAPISASYRVFPKCSSNMVLDTAAGHLYFSCFARFA
jgi:hypothetical protein